MFSPKQIISAKIAARKQKQIDETPRPAVADRMTADDLNEIMTRLGHPQFANFK